MLPGDVADADGVGGDVEEEGEEDEEGVGGVGGSCGGGVGGDGRGGVRAKVWAAEHFVSERAGEETNCHYGDGEEEDAAAADVVDEEEGEEGAEEVCEGDGEGG